MSDFETAVRSILDMAAARKAAAVAQQSAVADKSIIDVVHFLRNVLQYRVMLADEGGLRHGE